MKITVYSRSCNVELYGKMRMLIPPTVQCIRKDNYQQWWEASDYIHHIFENGTGWVVNVDEDAFIKDWVKIEQLISYMERSGFDYAGMPDGGVCPHRCRSWVVMNPFFTVFNMDSIRAKRKSLDHPNWILNSCGFYPEMENTKPEFIKGVYNHDNVEPFSGIFYWLHRYLQPLYLNAYTHNDGVSSLLHDHTGEIIVNHAWYSREFSTDPTHRKRILNLYEETRLYNSTVQG